MTGYNISVTSRETIIADCSDNNVTINYYTSNSHYLLSLTNITDAPYNDFTITVSGYNGLDGEDESISGEIMHYCFKNRSQGKFPPIP